jgi:inositol hexakisphosphate/diphosphoinositol-pentakisphosphate kinase
VRTALAKLDEPREKLKLLHERLRAMVKSMEKRMAEVKNITTYQDEPQQLILRRWSKLEEDLYDSRLDEFAVSKLPDLYDSLKYHLTHNVHFGLPETPEVYELAKAFADVVVPQEYGLRSTQKLDIGYSVAHNLMRKIVHDLRIAAGKQTKHAIFEHELTHRLDSDNTFIKIKSPDRHVRTRLYFSSESHVHSLLNLLRMGDIGRHCNTLAADRTTQAHISDAAPIQTAREAQAVGSVTAGHRASVTAAAPDHEAPHTWRGESRDSMAAAAAEEALSTAAAFLNPAATTSGAWSASVPGAAMRMRSNSDGASPGSESMPAKAKNSPQPDAPGDEAWVRAQAYLSGVPELNYLCHIVFRLFEQPNASPESPERFFVELLFSPGQERLPTSAHLEKTEVDLENLVVLHPHLALADVETFFQMVERRPWTHTAPATVQEAQESPME